MTEEAKAEEEREENLHEEIRRVEDKNDRLDIEMLHLKAMMARPMTVRFSGRALTVFVVAIGLMLMLPWVLASAVFRPANPEVHVAAPDVNIDAAELSDAIALGPYDVDQASGRIIRLNEATEVDRFERDCADVCTASGWDGEPGRVLASIPERQTCVCFTGRAVWRYVGWVHQR